MQILTYALIALSISIVVYVAYQIYRDCNEPLSHEKQFFDDYKNLDDESKVIVERFANTLKGFENE